MTLIVLFRALCSVPSCVSSIFIIRAAIFKIRRYDCLIYNTSVVRSDRITYPIQEAYFFTYFLEHKVTAILES